MNGVVATTCCPSCSQLIDASSIDNDGTSTCPSCNKRVTFTRFPAFAKASNGFPVIERREERESACFFHGRYRAKTPCDECGRFLCALCAIEFGSQTLCPECIHTLRRGPKATALSHQALLYDNLALSLVLLPVVGFFFFYFTIITAPAGLFASIFFFGRQNTIVPRSRFRFVIAMILAILEIIGMILFIIWFIDYLKNNVPGGTEL
jgi:uncharacterized paraquat-inducible protein A